MVAKGIGVWNANTTPQKLTITDSNNDLCTITGRDIVVRFTGTVSIIAFHTEPWGYNNAIPYINVYKNGVSILNAGNIPASCINSVFDVANGDVISIKAYNTISFARETKNGFMITMV